MVVHCFKQTQAPILKAPAPVDAVDAALVGCPPVDSRNRFAKLVPTLLFVLASASTLAETQRASMTLAPAPGGFVADLPILGERGISEIAFVDYLSEKNSSIGREDLEGIYRFYVEECAAEGVSLLVALAQMCHETNFLKFTGVVSPSQNNYAGLGAVDPGSRGLSFQSARIGIRAHVQHLVAYATTREPVAPMADPRFALVRRGSVSTVLGLTMKWAIDPRYGEKVVSHARRLEAAEATPR